MPPPQFAAEALPHPNKYALNERDWGHSRPDFDPVSHHSRRDGRAYLMAPLACFSGEPSANASVFARLHKCIICVSIISINAANAVGITCSSITIPRSKTCLGFGVARRRMAIHLLSTTLRRVIMATSACGFPQQSMAPSMTSSAGNSR
jgi:hypothetical protein